jgi:hypothetical protein
VGARPRRQPRCSLRRGARQWPGSRCSRQCLYHGSVLCMAQFASARPVL